jgi:hypothetical protein
MSEPVLKTSQEWSLDFTNLTILDPDGWDRQNFDYSFKEEKITKDEFLKRLARSTISFNLHL